MLEQWFHSTLEFPRVDSITRGLSSIHTLSFMSISLFLLGSILLTPTEFFLLPGDRLSSQNLDLLSSSNPEQEETIHLPIKHEDEKELALESDELIQTIISKHMGPDLLCRLSYAVNISIIP